MNHPVNVSLFLKSLYHGAKHGYSGFLIDFSGVNTAFPNVCVPIAGVIQFYQNMGFIFKFNDNMPEYLKRSYIDNPLYVEENEHLLNRTPLDIVWRFRNSEDVKNLVDAYINSVSRDIECQKGVIEGLDWCLNEVMDNVIQHAKNDSGYVMGQIHKTSQHIAFCIFDSGQGIYNSLKDTVHAPRNPIDAITLAIKEGVTRDKSIGQGNGMWGLHQIIRHNSGRLVVSSGSGSYMMTGEEIKTYSGLPYISRENGSTTIDFQIDTDIEISISNALGGYQPLNLRIENIED
ncbi:MAG: hypothetical protein PHN55_11035 [Dysgonamonadaceae bacterium]|nr:hypothetical protein [Dysgonamonadaceae bacterium]